MTNNYNSDDIPFTDEEYTAACSKSEVPAAERGDGSDLCATPNNIAHYKCIPDDFIPLKRGIDMLQMSYKGWLREGETDKFKKLKQLAQTSGDEHLAVATAR